MKLCWTLLADRVVLSIKLCHSTACILRATCSAEFILANHLSNYLNVPSLELQANFCRGLPVGFVPSAYQIVPAVVVSTCLTKTIRVSRFVFNQTSANISA